MSGLGFEPRIVAFICEGSAQSAAAQAGALGLSSSIRPVRLACLGRIDAALVLQAFASGADGVLALGCPVGRCRHRDGDEHAARRLALLQKLLAQLGVSPERVRLERLASYEAERFADVARRMTEQVRRLGPYA